MTEPDIAQKPGTPRWIKVLLVASLALNFIFVGGSAGFFLRSQGDRGSVSRDGALLLARAMPPRDRRELQREFRRKRGTIAAGFPGAAEQRDSIISILEKTPFDSEALLGVLGGQRERGMQIAIAGHETVVSRLTEMTDAERAAVARKLKKIRRRQSR